MHKKAVNKKQKHAIFRQNCHAMISHLCQNSCLRDNDRVHKGHYYRSYQLLNKLINIMGN